MVIVTWLRLSTLSTLRAVLCRKFTSHFLASHGSLSGVSQRNPKTEKGDLAARRFVHAVLYNFTSHAEIALFGEIRFTGY